MQLATESHVPKYAQIADAIRQRIARGVWPVGTRLPANEDLAQEFGVSRITIRQAVDLLQRDSLLDARQGSGTFVVGGPVENRWLRVETSLAALSAVYSDTSPQIINIDEGTARPPLLPDDGTPAENYVFMRRLHSREGKAYCVIAIYLDEKIFRTDPDRFRREVVIPILASMRKPAVASARQVLTVGRADLEVAKLLDIPLNAPVAEVRRIFKDAKGRVLYLGEVVYRGDFVRIEMDLKP